MRKKIRKKVFLTILIPLLACGQIFLIYVGLKLFPLLVTLLVFRAGIDGEGNLPVLMVGNGIAERYWYDEQGRPTEMLCFDFERYKPVLSFTDSPNGVMLLYPFPIRRARWVYGQDDSEETQQMLLYNIKLRIGYEEYEENDSNVIKYEHSSIFPTKRNLKRVTASWHKLDEQGRIAFYGFYTNVRDVNKITGDFRPYGNDYFVYEYDGAGRMTAEYSIGYYGNYDKKRDYILNSYEGSLLVKKSYYKVDIISEEAELYRYGTYSYEDGLLVQECYYNRSNPIYAPDEFEQRVEINYEYDNDGRLVKESERYGGGREDRYYYY